jgi:phospholipid N-methyltransferase
VTEAVFGLGLRQRIRFFQAYLKAPRSVGALAPSSAALADALCAPYRRSVGPARVLEVGAGTGAVTRRIVSLLRDQDRLDICEREPSLAADIERHLRRTPAVSRAVEDGRIRLLVHSVEEIDPDSRYDFIISGLPLTSFSFDKVREVFAVMRRSLNPGGVISYFEYAGLRRLSRTFTLGRDRTRIRDVSSHLSQQIVRHQFDRATVLNNFPPAYARHLRFD